MPHEYISAFKVGEEVLFKPHEFNSTFRRGRVARIEILDDERYSAPDIRYVVIFNDGQSIDGFSSSDVGRYIKPLTH